MPRPSAYVNPIGMRISEFFHRPRCLRAEAACGTLSGQTAMAQPTAQPDPARLARQALAVDAALGMDAVWLGRAARDEAAAAEPAAATADPPGRQAPAATNRPAPRPAAAGRRASSASRGGGHKAAHLPDVPEISLDDLAGRTLSTEEKTQQLQQLRQQVTAFIEAGWPTDGWQRIVFGEGDPDAAIMFVGEGPGAEEDQQGRPFVGRAGQLLDKQIQAMGLQREQVYITNIARTRPPGNRVPTPEEAARMLPFLQRQMHIIQPRVVVALGATAAKYLLDDMDLRITKERGIWRKAYDFDVLPTFHPAYLLRSYTSDNRRRVWDDLQKVMKAVGLK